MKKILKAIAACAVAVCGAAAAGCSGAGWLTSEGAAWATTYHITYHAPQALDDSVVAVMKMVEMSLSPFNRESAVSRVNAGATDSVDGMFEKVFGASLKVNAASGGLYDPTVAPLVNLWGFGYKDRGLIPDSTSVDSCRSLVGLAGCRVERGRVVRAVENMEFDFSSITKGLGCDLVGEMLARNGVTDYMVEIGGEMALRGLNPRGEKWHVMIDAPVSSDTAALHNRMAMIEVTDCGVATSGNYRNYRQTPAGKVWHSISPVTGRPAETSLLSATVIARTAMEADALATACMVMPGAAEALAMIEGMEGAEALLVEDDGAGGYRLSATTGFPEIKK